jgi:hypothetical protein
MVDLRWLLYPQWVAANTVFWVFLAISIILWIVLMYQTYHGRLLKLAAFGDWAQKLLVKLDEIKEKDFIHAEAKARQEPPPTPEAKETPKTEAKGRIRRHLESTRGGRITSSVATIVWSTVFLVFFNFFSKYFAIYSREVVDGVTRWSIYPMLTQDLSQVLPILNITLILSIVGHSVAIALDKYLARQIILIVLSVLGMITVLTFLRVFPFDFSMIPHAGAAAVIPTVAVVIMILITVGLGISALVRFIRLIIKVARRASAPNPLA